MSTLVLTQSYSPQSLTWDVAGALWAAMQVLFWAFVAVALGAGLLGIFAVIAMIPPTFWLGLALTGVFAYVTYPRKAVTA